MGNVGDKIKFGPKKTVHEITKIKKALVPTGQDVYVMKGPKGAISQAVKEGGRFKKLR